MLSDERQEGGRYVGPQGQARRETFPEGSFWGEGLQGDFQPRLGRARRSWVVEPGKLSAHLGIQARICDIVHQDELAHSAQVFAGNCLQDGSDMLGQFVIIEFHGRSILDLHCCLLRIRMEAFEMLEPLFHIAQQAIHLGQTGKEDRGPSPEGVIHGRVSGDDPIGFDRGRDAGLCRGNDIIADAQMARSAHLTGQHDVPSHFSASGQSDLSTEERVLAHFASVSDLHQIVDLHVRGDDRVSDGRAINGRIGSDLDPIADDHAARLRDFVPEAIGIARIAEAIGSDSRSVVDDHMCADDRVLSDGYL